MACCMRHDHRKIEQKTLIDAIECIVELLAQTGGNSAILDYEDIYKPNESINPDTAEALRCVGICAVIYI